MKFPPFPRYAMSLLIDRLREFTFIPRRFSTHYWDDRHCLISITWWQWFRRCFCVHSHIVNRPEFSSWKQITNRMNNGDLDAKLLWKCIEVMQSRKYDYCEPADEIYRKLVDGVDFVGIK